MNQELLEEVIQELTQITDYLYQENIPLANRGLVFVLPKLEACIGGIEEEDTQKELRDKLMEALSAMEEEDYVLLADLIQYEVLEILSSYAN